jgi:hypothetical protein
LGTTASVFLPLKSTARISSDKAAAAAEPTIGYLVPDKSWLRDQLKDFMILASEVAS